MRQILRRTARDELTTPHRLRNLLPRIHMKHAIEAIPAFEMLYEEGVAEEYVVPVRPPHALAAARVGVVVERDGGDLLGAWVEVRGCWLWSGRVRGELEVVVLFWGRLLRVLRVWKGLGRVLLGLLLLSLRLLALLLSLLFALLLMFLLLLSLLFLLIDVSLDFNARSPRSRTRICHIFSSGIDIPLRIS